MSELVMTRGNKKTSSATCKCERTGEFEIRVNKVPLSIIEDKLLVGKFEEILRLVTPEVLEGLDFEITLENRNGSVGNIYAGRQAFCRAILAYFSTYSDEYKKQEIKNTIMAFDRYALVTDTRRKEPKKYGGPGARARYQKSYR
jgi:small subunit ribosomal protein S16e